MGTKGRSDRVAPAILSVQAAGNRKGNCSARGTDKQLEVRRPHREDCVPMRYGQREENRKLLRRKRSWGGALLLQKKGVVTPKQLFPPSVLRHHTTVR